MQIDLDSIPIKTIMITDVFTANLKHTWRDVARKMSSHRLHHLVVVDDNHRPQGVMSTYDFLAAAFDEKGELMNRPLHDYMPHHRLVSLSEDNSVFEAAATISVENIDSIVILKGDRLMGIVTSRDIVNLMVEETDKARRLRQVD